MHRLAFIAFILLLSFFCKYTYAQSADAAVATTSNLTETEKELRTYFDEYGADLRDHKREAIADRYDPRGYYRMGQGTKRFVSFQDVRKQYLTNWQGPKVFEWKDMVFDVISPESAMVFGLFDWHPPTGDKRTFSYSALMLKRDGKWYIRSEDESMNPSEFSSTVISGNSTKEGPFKYTFRANAMASITAHRHSVDMHITVKSGKKFILMGDLNTATVKVYEAGSTFTIPANTWHVEWWEENTVEEISGIGPMKTERANAQVPRK